MPFWKVPQHLQWWSSDSDIDELGKSKWYKYQCMWTGRYQSCWFLHRKRHSCHYGLLSADFPNSNNPPQNAPLRRSCNSMDAAMAYWGQTDGEQGAESIHAHFNRIEMQYNGIVNPLDRLMSSMSTTWSRHLDSILWDRNIKNTGNAPEMTHRNCSSLTFSSFISYVLS